MDRITLRELESLWKDDSTPCISIFLPMHPGGRDTLADPIVLKNLAREAERQLVARPMREADARALLTPVEALVSDTLFWKHPTPGLAVFLSPHRFQTLRLGHAPPPRVVVGERFHVRPLLRALEDERAFQVLAVSLNHVRLLRASAQSVQALPLPDAPRGLKDFLRYEDGQADTQYRQSGQGGTFSGGGRQADHKDEQRRYVRAVAAAVKSRLGESRDPLVFAGVPALYAMLREDGLLPTLLPQALTGNPDRRSAESLRDAALPLVAAWREIERNTAVAELGRFAGTGRTLTGVAAVLPAAMRGQVDALLLRDDSERWGRFAPDAGTVHPHAAQEPGDEELLDVAASLTLQAGGRVLTLPEPVPAELGISDGLAALLRY